MDAIYESAAETAKKIRAKLKAEFPGVKFSVRSETYSMGSSVTVSWTDGPERGVVHAIVNKFESSSFDGMTDSSTTHGYMLEGKRYIGAKYIKVTRHRSGH